MSETGNIAIFLLVLFAICAFVPALFGLVLGIGLIVAIKFIIFAILKSLS